MVWILPQSTKKALKVRPFGSLPAAMVTTPPTRWPAVLLSTSQRRDNPSTCPPPRKPIVKLMYLTTKTIYQEHGYKDREDYLDSLRYNYGNATVNDAIQFMPLEEDFNGLVARLEETRNDLFGFRMTELPL